MSDPDHRSDQPEQAGDEAQSHPGSEHQPQPDPQPPPQQGYQPPPQQGYQSPPQPGQQPPGWQHQATPPGGYQQTPPPGGWQQPPPQSHYQQPGAAYGSKVGLPGELLDRFLARLIDGILLAIVGGILIGTIIVGVLMQGSTGTLGFGGSGFLANAVSAVLSAALYLGYFTFMESSRGQTVGKMLMKLETRGPDGGRPSVEQALRRNAWTAIGLLGVIPLLGSLVGSLASIAVAIIIAVGINNDPAGRRGWHDKFAGGTQVFKIG